MTIRRSIEWATCLHCGYETTSAADLEIMNDGAGRCPQCSESRLAWLLADGTLAITDSELVLTLTDLHRAPVGDDCPDHTFANGWSAINGSTAHCAICVAKRRATEAMTTQPMKHEATARSHGAAACSCGAYWDRPATRDADVYLDAHLAHFDAEAKA